MYSSGPLTVTGALPIARTCAQSRLWTIGRHGSYDGWQVPELAAAPCGLAAAPGAAGVASGMLLPHSRVLGTAGFLIAGLIALYMVGTILWTDRRK